MSLARQVPDAAKARQIAAADPERSVFVSANAGSGKTHVLVQRVINLLLTCTTAPRLSGNSTS